MAHRQMSNGDTKHHFLTRRDEQSLAEEVATSVAGTRPDSLDVHDDSIAIAQGTLSEMRGPAMIAGVLVGASVLLLLGIGYLSRRVSKME
jgi:hypothetical protein